jgi:hypothetical protein
MQIPLNPAGGTGFRVALALNTMWFRALLARNDDFSLVSRVLQEPLRDGDKRMNPEEKSCQDVTEGACEGCSCFNDPEDALLDLSKMTPEEMKQYLNELFRNRSFGC